MKKNVFILLLGLFLLSSLIKSYSEYRKNVSFYNKYQADYQKELQNNTHLKTQIVKATDSAEVEKTIRNKLNLLKENEVAIIVPTPTSVPTTPTPAPQAVYKQWLNLFLKEN
jgi:cell division protein FtsB